MLSISPGGTAICSKTGHAFMKERMRQENSVYGGEMSAHHYFRDFLVLRQWDDSLAIDSGVDEQRG